MIIEVFTKSMCNDFNNNSFTHAFHLECIYLIIGYISIKDFISFHIH